MNNAVLDRAHGCLGLLPLRFLAFLAAVWVGCFCGACSLLVGLIVDGGRFDVWLFLPLVFSPLLLLNELLCVNGFVLAIVVFLNWRLEGMGPRFWGVFAALEGLIVTFGWLGEINSPGAIAACFGVLAVTTGMMGVGVWFGRQWWYNRWAGELAMLRASNAQRFAEREERKKKARSPKGTRS